MRKKIYNLLVFFPLFILFGCGGIDKNKFENIDRAATTLNSSISVGINNNEYTKLILNLKVEIDLLNGKNLNKKEYLLLEQYNKLFNIYIEGVGLWDIIIRGGTIDPTPPKGYTPITLQNNEQLELYTTKYGLTIEKKRFNFYSTFAQGFVESGKPIDMVYTEGAVQKIWSSAKIIHDGIKDILSGKITINEPREISYSHNLPKSASDVHEYTDYLLATPDEEYRYYLKAKITEEEFLNFVKGLKLVWASPIQRDGVPKKNTTIPWWNPPSSLFIYALGNGSKCIMQADYVSITGYMYFYVVQN